MSYKLLRQIIRSLPNHIYWKDRNGVIRGCNDQQAISFGLSVTEIIGKTDFDLLDRREAELIRANDQTILETGRSQILEETITLPIGKITYISHKIPLKDNKGDVIGILGSSINITELKESQQSVYEAKVAAEKQKDTLEIYLKNVISNLPGHVYWEDINGTFLGCNEQQAVSCGLEKPEDLIGKTIFDMGKMCGWNESILKSIRKHDLEVIQTGCTISVEEEAVWADKIPRTFLSKKAPLKDHENNCIGVVGISFDISDRKKLETELREAKEKAEQANRSKSLFIANISHDLRTPLHAIISTAELLKVKTYLTGQEEYIDTLTHASKTLLRLIENVLDTSTLEEGKVRVNYQEFNLWEIINDIVASAHFEAEKKGLGIVFNYDGSAPKKVISDPEQITRILINILGNALKFTHKGKISVNVETIEHSNKLAVLSISVTDTGIGIPESELPKVFERFHRVEASYKNQNSGTGLGLSIAKKLVHLLKGDIRVESQLGVGSKFICTLPFKLPVHSDTYEAHSKTQEITLEKFPPLSILLVEDTVMIQKITSDLLKEFGLKVTAVDTGKKALQLAPQGFDLIFMDIGLPDYDGFEVVQKMREADITAPIIALTAHSTDEIKEKCLNSGVNDYLCKPVSYQEIFTCLKKHIDAMVTK